MDDDPVARLRAEMDQAREGVKEFAGSLWAFYSELRDQGFDADQAFELARTWLVTSLRGMMGDDE